jgi:hypothetical protein
MKKLAICGLTPATTIVLVTLFSLTALNAQPASPLNPRLVIRSGLVEVQRGNTWLPVSLGDSLTAGDRIRTASGSTAALEVGPGKVITLNEQSQVQVGQSPAPIVQLESGSMKVFSASDIQVSAKDTILESDASPLDLELGYQADKLNLTVFNGAVRTGPMIIRGGNQDPTVRTYTANGVSSRRNQNIIANPTFYIYPYFMYGYPDPNAGRIVPPVVRNPTNPGYRPTQIVPPMSDPIRVPVTQP